MSSSINNKVILATKWSALAEILSKLMTPISNMLLARILTPEAFGVITTISMIVSFVEIFTDAGFSKYIIQHEFTNEDNKNASINVAFWSNLLMSLIFCLIICAFCEVIADIVGNPGLGYVVAISSISIPLAAFSSIQFALFKRDMDFKTLFKVRFVGVCIPIFVTVPLALWLRSYWALLLGVIIQNLANASLLTLYSRWKPKLFFSYVKFKEMFSFSAWSMLESISIWLTTYIDVFIVGTLLSQYYLGLYKTSTVIVGQIMGLITSTTTPILFSALSRLQNSEEEFKKLFFRFQKIVSITIVPIGVVIYCYSDLITIILLGEKWMEASYFIGLWGLTGSIMVVLAFFSSEVYRAKGKPKLSVLSQWLHIVVLWPVVIFSIKYGYVVLCTARALVRLEGVFVNLIIMSVCIGISGIQMVRNVFPAFIAGALAVTLSEVMKCYWGSSIILSFPQIVFTIISYILVLSCFNEERKLFFNLPFYLKRH